jgi:hypothetical protein
MNLANHMVWTGPQEDLNAAVWGSACPDCGAQPQKACKQKTRDVGMPDTTTKQPHMDRVKAGHMKLRNEK